MAKAVRKEEILDPDKRPLTKMQAGRLAGLTGVEAKEFAGKVVAELSERFKWQLDVSLFLFRRVCGQVVKRDPVTGRVYPVPFATVHVEDTDCNLLGYFPAGWHWGWYFPLSCRREEIATVVTDECGRFCVYIPRFDIDWILKFRKERICFPDIFIRPNLRELLEDLKIWPEPPVIRRPFPEPDPIPFLLNDGGLRLRRIEEAAGPQVAGRLAAIQATAMLGAATGDAGRMLEARAFTQPVAPPLPAQMQRMPGREVAQELSLRYNLEPKLLERFNPEYYIGPFRRCWDVLVPEWVPLLDVPDITFRVTQDVDGDGDQEVIYSESFFDVRWDSGSIPDVTLEASQIALAGLTCDSPEVPCQEPMIVLAGKMPLHNLPAPADPYHDNTTGYARRTNRPHPSGDLVDPLPNPLASSPMAGTFPVLGCNQMEGAVYYRLMYAYRAPGGASFSAPVPFVNVGWSLYRWVGSPGHLEVLHVTPDANGWYNILNPADMWLPQNILLNWPSGNYQDGTYRISMQMGNAAKAVIHTTPELAVYIDNSSPSTSRFTGLAWRRVGDIAWTELGLVCPVVRRNPGEDIEFRVDYIAAAAHLRSFVLSAGGCGGGGIKQVSPLSTAQHWHTNALDNSVAGSAIYRLPGSSLPGAYSFHLHVDSRAFNPDDANGLTSDWNYDPTHIWVNRQLAVAVVE
jgi:hypothetical protein